jgi:hypothetical protein
MAKAKKAKSNVIPFPPRAKKKEPEGKVLSNEEMLALRRLMTDEMNQRRKTKRAAHMIRFSAVVTDEAFSSIRKIVTKTQGWFEYLNVPGQFEIAPLN